MCEDGYREAMAGNVPLYDAAGERMRTSYLGERRSTAEGRFWPACGAVAVAGSLERA